MPPDATRPAPRHLWIVGALSLLWNAGGAFDFLMTVTRNDAYLAAMTPEQVGYVTGFPAWATAAWAVAVWASVAGSVGLLLRARWAAPVFGVALVAMAATALHNLVLSDGARILGGAGAWAFTAAIWIVGIGLFLYAREMARRGVLR